MNKFHLLFPYKQGGVTEDYEDDLHEVKDVMLSVLRKEHYFVRKIVLEGFFKVIFVGLENGGIDTQSELIELI